MGEKTYICRGRAIDDIPQHLRELLEQLLGVGAEAEDAIIHGREVQVLQDGIEVTSLALGLLFFR